MRQALVVGNWKMHGSRASVDSLLAGLTGSIAATAAEVAVCPSYVHLAQSINVCADSSVAVGAQDCSHMASGAYTGEVAADMLVDLGCRWVILGHSERRQYHDETDGLVAAKLSAAVVAGLLPIVCVGETREQRESGDAETVVAAQLQGALAAQPRSTRAGGGLRAGLGYRHRADSDRPAGTGYARVYSRSAGHNSRGRCPGNAPALWRQREVRQCGGAVCAARYRRRPGGWRGTGGRRFSGHYCGGRLDLTELTMSLGGT